MNKCCNNKKIIEYRKILKCENCGMVFGPIRNNNTHTGEDGTNSSLNSKKPALFAYVPEMSPQGSESTKKISQKTAIINKVLDNWLEKTKKIDKENIMIV
ncbi:MAG: hypothetical protein ACTSRG_06800 [Candidatus Helarchaeota archaeon]